MQNRTGITDLWSRSFLQDQIEKIVNFYYPECIDEKLGGYINQFRDDGSIFDDQTKHLVGTCRFVYIFSIAAILTEKSEYKKAARHGVQFLLNHHRQPKGGYAWILEGLKVNDATNHCYGHAFVLLAFATSLKAGIQESAEPLVETFNLMERRFWRQDDRLYVDEISSDWSIVDPYRGQNANMHTCEAMIAAFEATGETNYLDRATALAIRVCVDMTQQSDGMIWEHYDKKWDPDWQYNLDDPKNLFRPFGYLVGHWMEWAKLLLILEENNPQEWMLPHAKRLFNAAIEQGWDHNSGGMNYAVSPNGEIIDTDRYYWVLSETVAAAGLLANRTGDSTYTDWYSKSWTWSLENLVDQQYGGWYRVLDNKNQRYNDLKSPASKTDYHPVAACWEVLKRI
jgi:mannose/cellobiose epimerase-like protein (N-acyl-D-glucosamine 2-epimerase family)